MAWTASAIHATGDIVTAANWNSTVGLANSPVLAKAVLTSAQTSYTTGLTILFNGMATLGGFANGPTLASGQLTPNTAGIYEITVGVQLGFTGTCTSHNLQLFASLSSTVYLIGQSYQSVESVTGNISCQAAGVVNMAAGDFVYAQMAFAGGTAASILATATGVQTFLSMTMTGVL